MDRVVQTAFFVFVCGTSLPMTKYGYECPQLPCPRTSKLFMKTNRIESIQQYHGDNLLELGNFASSWRENKETVEQ